MYKAWSGSQETLILKENLALRELLELTGEVNATERLERGL